MPADHDDAPPPGPECEHCGYSLVGHAVGSGAGVTCPECGGAATGRRPTAMGPSFWFASAPSVALLVISLPAMIISPSAFIVLMFLSIVLSAMGPPAVALAWAAFSPSPVRPRSLGGQASLVFVYCLLGWSLLLVVWAFFALVAIPLVWWCMN